MCLVLMIAVGCSGLSVCLILWFRIPGWIAVTWQCAL